MDIYTRLAKVFKGDIDTKSETLDFYSHDASLFELKPEVVVFPKDAPDIAALVKFVKEHKKNHSELSITPRSRGTDMSGGAIGESIVMDVSKYMTKLKKVTPTSAHVEPGMLYREFEPETLKQGSIMPLSLIHI